MSDINDAGKYKGYTLFPFGENSYKDKNDMYRIIEELCKEDGRKYIYAYDTEPDSTMHDLGNDSKEAHDIMTHRENIIGIE